MDDRGALMQARRMCRRDYNGDPALLSALQEAVRHLASSAGDPAAVEVLRDQATALLNAGLPVDDEIGAALDHAITIFYLSDDLPRR